MIIRWLGHACFYCQGEGLGLLTDPFDQQVGYPLPAVEADLVTVSHDHYDHNAVDLLPGDPEVIREPGEHKYRSLLVKGYSVYHDEVKGAKRGKNIIFSWEMDGVRLCHLGDLGHLLDAKTIEAIGELDILMVPVGGVYTIDAKEAREVVNQLKPRVIIPMHYKTPHLSFELEALDNFTKYFERIRREKHWQGTKDDLPSEQEVVVLDYLA
ncbi:MAG TPA: MBL fold metallo-hydrolase [Syntrophomonadaceae bacterium]|nr:MBL fold metallo-hydrolase [Syntrophomonadaceae bacterium]